jgi:DNA-binding MarR family transcriptional regulator
LKKLNNIPLGTKALIFSKHYYGVISSKLQGLDIERYFSILFFLQQNNGCTQQQICNHMAIDKTAMVKVIDYLIENGYVKRSVNPEDRRAHFIHLTAKGEENTRQISSAFNELDKELLCSLNESERKLFIKTLQQLTLKVSTLPGDDLFFEYNKTKTTKRTKKHSL